MYFIISQTIILLIIFFLIWLISWFLPTDSPWSPWWSTSEKVARRICRLVRLSNKDVFYELGSGTGTTAVIAAEEFDAKVIGIETSKSRVWWSRCKAKRHDVSDKVIFLDKNFYTVDLSPATVVYFYLVPRVIRKLKKKLLIELKPGTRVISYMYEIDYLPLIKEDDRRQLYVYKIP